jgi:UDP-2,4-diacetamido-2,4,6-trideoxy-beta-L-altropyranose hydrolase
MKFVFRADASLRIGTGHVMRCLTLASELRRRGMDCRFACRPLEGDLFRRIGEEGFEILALPDVQGTGNGEGDAPWLDIPWQTDAEQSIAALAGSRPDWLVVDHYGLDARWEKALRPHCGRIMAIDDRADRPHDIDLLLDQNLVADLDTRYQGLLPAQAVALLGPRYALLQEVYSALHREARPRTGPVRRILIYFGGADQADLTGRTLRAFLGLGRDDIGVDIVGNPESPFHKSWQALSEAHGNLVLHGALDSLAPLMSQADLAVGAGGATSWERLCLGLPALVVSLADNQRPIAEELNRQGLVQWVGHADALSEAELSKALQKVLGEPLPARWSIQCLSTVDGLGARRVAAALTLNADTPLKARCAAPADEALILEWANDPLVRSRSFDTGRIEPQAHKSWFQAKLANPGNCRYWIVETNDGLPIGQVRFEGKEGEWEIHYGLASVARGRGLGSRLLETAIATFPDPAATPLMGRVKPDNTPSIRIFEKLGFRGIEEDGRRVFRRP